MTDKNNKLKASDFELDSPEITDESEPKPNGVFAVPGVIIDEFTGKTWAMPTGEFLDNIKPHQSPYDIKKDPNFHYEFHTVKEASSMESQGFVKVTRKEVGLEDNKLPGEVSSPLDQYYIINGEQVAMKIPKVYGEKRYATLKKFCDDAVKSTEPVRGSDPNIQVETTHNLTQKESEARS